MDPDYRHLAIYGGHSVLLSEQWVCGFDCLAAKEDIVKPACNGTTRDRIFFLY
jgi:hypothetical protein